MCNYSEGLDLARRSVPPSDDISKQLGEICAFAQQETLELFAVDLHLTETDNYLLVIGALTQPLQDLLQFFSKQTVSQRSTVLYHKSMGITNTFTPTLFLLKPLL